MSAQLVEALRAVLGYADLCDMPAAQEACQKARAAIAAAEAPTVAQPVAWFLGEPGNYREVESWAEGAIPVYTAPPQPVPLTDEQIAEANEDCGDPIPFSFDVVPLVRACIAEFCRINGIGGKA